jgi:hypothetical protein
MGVAQGPSEEIGEMRVFQRLLHEVFPLLALAGLLLAMYAMVQTPDDFQANQEAARWGAQGDGLQEAAPGQVAAIDR